MALYTTRQNITVPTTFNDTDIFTVNEGAANGGAVYNSSTATFIGSTFSDNTATNQGGAVYNSGTATFDGSLFIGNTAASGASIYSTGKTILNNSTISNASVGSPAIFANGGLLQLNSTTITNHTATAYGGAIFNAGRSTISLAGDTRFEHIQGNRGGAIYLGAGYLYVADGVVFNDNKAVREPGGAIDVQNDGNNRLFDNGGTYTYNKNIQYGGAVAFSGGGHGTFTGAYFLGNSAGNRGGAIYMNGQSTVSVEGTTFTANSSGEGGAIYVLNSLAVLNVTDSLFDANVSSGGNGGGINNAGILTITGSSFTNHFIDAESASSYRSGAGLLNKGTATIGNSLFHANYAKTDGGAIYTGASSTALTSITGSTFTANTSTEAGALSIATGTVTVASSQLTGNYAKGKGGAASNYGTASFSSSTFSGNTAGNYGGALYNKGDMTVSGSLLNGNTSTEGGALCNDGTGSVIISSSTISGNTATTGGAILNAGSGVIQISGSTISGNTATTGGAIANASATGTITIVNSLITENGANTAGAISNAGTVTVTGSTFSHNSIPNAASVSASAATLDNSGRATFDHTLITAENFRKSAGNGNVISNNSGANLVFTASTISNVSGNSAIIRNNSGNVTVTDSLFTDSQGNEYGGIAWTAGGTFSLYGNTRVENIIATRGVLYVGSGRAYAYEGVVFEGNTASSDHGGAVNLQNNAGARYYDTGATYTRNYAKNSGGAANNGGGSVGSIVTGFTNSLFLENRAGSNGGAIDNFGTMSISGATFTANTAGSNGGAIRNSTPATIANSKLFSNHAQNGGAIYNSGSATVSGSTISGNEATNDGGAIYNTGTASNLLVSGSTISGNVAAANGGAINNNTSAVLTIENSWLTDNTGVNGGAIYNSATITVTGSTISGNTLVNDASVSAAGSAIYNSGLANINNTLITDENYIVGKGNGSPIRNMSGGRLSFTGSTITNLAGKTADITNNGNVTLTDTVISHSNNSSYGGAIWTADGTFSLYGNTRLEYNRGTRAGALYVASGKAYAYEGVVFEGNTAYTDHGGAITMQNNAGAKYYDSGATYTRNYTKNMGGAIDVGGNAAGTSILASFTNSLFLENYAVGNGGGIHNRCALVVDGATFTGNTGSQGGALHNDAGGTATFANAKFNANFSHSGSGGAIQNASGAILTITGSTFTGNVCGADPASNYRFGGALDNTGSTATVVDTIFDHNFARTQGGAIANRGTSTIAISGSTFTANTAAEGGAFYGAAEPATIANSLFTDNYSMNGPGGAIRNAVILNITGSTFSGNTGSNGGAIYSAGTSAVLTITDSIFATSSDTIVNGWQLTLSGSITLNATLGGSGTNTVDGVDFIFSGDTAISVATLTPAGDGITSATFANTGKVTFRSLDLSTPTITINQSDAGNYAIADGISALNTNLTVNGTATTLVSGTGTSASADGQLAQVVTFASNALNLSVYDKLYVGFDVATDDTHFATLADLEATYANYNGTIIDASSITKVGEVFYNPDWTSANLPASTTLADGSTVALTWEANAFSELGMAKAYLDVDGILTFEGVVPTTAQTSDVDTVRIHDVSGTNVFRVGNNSLILDGVTFGEPQNVQVFFSGNGDDDNLSIMNVNGSGKYFYTGYASRSGDFNFTFSDSTAARFYLANDSSNSGTINFTANNSTVTERISLTSSSSSSITFNNVCITLNDTLVTGGVWATGSSPNINILGDSSVTLNNSTATDVYGSRGNILHGDVYLELNGSTAANVIGKEIADNVQGTSYLLVGGTATSVISDVLTTIDQIAVEDDSTLALGDVTITNCTFVVNPSLGVGMPHHGGLLDPVIFNPLVDIPLVGDPLIGGLDGTIAILDGCTVTLAGNVTIAKDFALDTNAAIVAADDAVITLTGTTFDMTIAAGTASVLVFDNASALSVTADVTGFATVTFAGDEAVDMNSNGLESLAITVDTNNVWTNGTTTIATGISSLYGSTFTVNGLSATLGTAMANGAILDYDGDALTLTVTAVTVDNTNSLDAALAATAADAGVIIFSAETDGTTCTFSGNTIGHEQVFQGNGAINTAIASADSSMVFANGNAITMTDLAWSGILYGGNQGGDSASASLSFQDAAIGGNVFGGGRANTGSTIADGDISLAIADSTQTAGKAVYGGAYANGGTATVDSISLTLADVNAGTNSVYGGGAVNNGGALEVVNVATEISGGVYGAVYNGANIYTAGTDSSFEVGPMSLEINGGTFSGAVGNGSTPRAGASSAQGASTLAITDGLFDGQVYGGAASFGGNASVASTTVSISGGTFNGNIYGGNVGQTGAKAASTRVTGAVNLTIDSSDANVYLNGNVYGASMGTGPVGGDVNVTFTGDGSRLHFGTASFVSGDSEYAYSRTSYVEGAKNLIFDDFSGSFSGNFQGPAFDTVTLKNGSSVNFRSAQANQDFELVSTWNFELSNASAVMITDDNAATTVKNNFIKDTINVTFADDADAFGETDWTVFKGTEATLKNWNKLAGVTIDGVAADGALDGGSYKVWTTDDYKVYVDSNYDIRLAKLA